MNDFLDNAGRIFETANSTAGSELTILIAGDGAIRILMESDWPLGSLEAHYGARAVYRVSRDTRQLRVEGKSRTASCLLQAEPVASVARRLLSDSPRYILAPQHT